MSDITGYLCLLSSPVRFAVYGQAFRFITGCKPLTHHCSQVDWSSLAPRRYHFLYKIYSDLLSSYISEYMLHKQSQTADSGHHYVRCSISSYRAWEEGFLLFCSVLIAQRSEALFTCRLQKTYKCVCEIVSGDSFTFCFFYC